MIYIYIVPRTYTHLSIGAGHDCAVMRTELLWWTTIYLVNISLGHFREHAHDGDVTMRLKKWMQLANANSALRELTVCSSIDSIENPTIMMES